MTKGKTTGRASDGSELDSARRKSKELVAASLDREARRLQALELSAVAKGPAGRKRRRAMTDV